MSKLDQQQVWEMIEDLREWAKDRWGEAPIDPTGPEVGSKVSQMAADSIDDVWEDYTYTQKMHQRDYEANPHRYKPRWLYELQELIGGEEIEGEEA